MRNLICLLIILAAQTCIVQAQTRNIDTLNQTDQYGRKQGYWMKYDHDTLKYEGRFRDDSPVEEFKYYYSDGHLKARARYMDEHRSTATLYHASGTKAAEGDYWDTLKDGIWKYYDEEGTLVSDETYDHNVKTGVWKTYYADGATVEEFTYQENKKNGPWNQYFPDGSLKLSGKYSQDQKNGPFQLFYPNQKMLLSGFYKNDGRDGDWLYYLEDGSLQKRRSYCNGNLVHEIIYVETEEDKK
jgi:antitoxin component YwqK of YwqJK toxin-antitoxin module